MTVSIPCPRCSSTGYATHDDRHAETIQDRCRECSGTGQIRAATGERRESACDPETGRAFGQIAPLFAPPAPAPGESS